MDLAVLPSATAPPDLALSPSPSRPAPLETAAPPRLSVVIVNYCEWQSTADLTRHMLNAPCTRRGLVEVVIVDNHSPAHPLIRRLRRLPQVSVRRWRRNQGFARAANEGCRLSRGEWMLLLNPDVTLPDHFLDSALMLADEISSADPRAGVIGFELRNGDGSPQLSSGLFPTLARTLAGLALPRHRRKYRRVRSERACLVPWVTGCCLLMRRECVQQLGGLDEDFFLYYEDVDFCRRAAAAGWNVWYEPRVYAIHHRPLHTRTVPPPLRLMTRHALLTYSAKHWPRWQQRLLSLIVRAEGRCRRWLAHWDGNASAANTFAELEAVAADLGRDRPALARRRLQEVVQHLHVEGRRPYAANLRGRPRAAEPVRHHSQS